MRTLNVRCLPTLSVAGIALVAKPDRPSAKRGWPPGGRQLWPDAACGAAGTGPDPTSVYPGVRPTPEAAAARRSARPPATTVHSQAHWDREPTASRPRGGQVGHTSPRIPHSTVFAVRSPCKAGQQAWAWRYAGAGDPGAKVRGSLPRPIHAQPKARAADEAGAS